MAQGETAAREAGRYKVVELSSVTDEALEEVLNTYSAQGYQLEGIHFAMRESSKRPAMAFVVFARAS
jgi:hypothetical protein